MIVALELNQSLKAAELQDGDIVCFQRIAEKKGDKSILEEKMDLRKSNVLEEKFVSAAIK
jgi:hypothetical protein